MKMPVKFVSGDLLADEGITAFAHGCNTKGAMGAGIAKDIKKLFPNNYSDYRQACLNGAFHPGYVRVYSENGKEIYNLATQSEFGEAKLEHIRHSLINACAIASAQGITKIGMPRIGAGLGGLEWEDVKKVIQEVCENQKIEFIVFEDFVPGQKNYTEKTEKPIDQKKSIFDDEDVKAEKKVLLELSHNQRVGYANKSIDNNTLIALVDIFMHFSTSIEVACALSKNIHLPPQVFEELILFLNETYIKSFKARVESVTTSFGEVLQNLINHKNCPPSLVFKYDKSKIPTESKLSSEDFVKSLSPKDILESNDSPLLFKLATSFSGVYKNVGDSYRKHAIKRYCRINKDLTSLIQLINESKSDDLKDAVINCIDDFETLNVLSKTAELKIPGGLNLSPHNILYLKSIIDIELETKINTKINTLVQPMFTEEAKKILGDEIINSIKEKYKDKETLFDLDGKANEKQIKKAILDLDKLASSLKGESSSDEKAKNILKEAAINLQKLAENLPFKESESNRSNKIDEARKHLESFVFKYDSSEYTNFVIMTDEIRAYAQKVKGEVFCADGDGFIGFYINAEKENDCRHAKISLHNLIKYKESIKESNPSWYSLLSMAMHTMDGKRSLASGLSYKPGSKIQDTAFDSGSKLVSQHDQNDQKKLDTQALNGYDSSTLKNITLIDIDPINTITLTADIEKESAENKPMNNILAPDLLKKASIRIVCDTTSAGTKDFIVKILKDRGADDFIISTITEYIDTPIGQSVISLIYACGLPQTKRIEFFRKNATLIDEISQEFAIQAATKSGKVVLETLTNMFLPVIQGALEMMQESSESESSESVLTNSVA
jgi:O-acetyl-ADP-ribose deacetylase (regulator of RNase III)